MPASPGFDFATIGINHGHVYAQTSVMIEAGCRLKAFYGPEDDLAAPYCEAFPGAKRVADEREILEDPEIKLIIGAGILADRAPMAVRAMRHGKDVMLDKPGKRAAAIDADFVGFTCPDKFVVGYGMDVAHAFRELPFVGIVEGRVGEEATEDGGRGDGDDTAGR